MQHFSRSRNKVLVTLVGVVVSVFLIRGGRSLWIGNRLMLAWTTHNIMGLSPQEFTVPSIEGARSNLPNSALLAYGRVAFAKGKYLEAANYYEQAQNLVEHNSVALSEMVISLSRASRFEKVISLYELHGDGLFQQRNVRDSVLVAHLHQLDIEQHRQPTANDISNLETIAHENLYVTYFILMERYGATQVSELPVHAQRQLANFPIESVLPDDERLLDYFIHVVPELVGTGVWDKERFIGIAYLWSWQYPLSTAVDRLMEIGLAHFGEDDDWNNLADELAIRRRKRLIDNTNSGSWLESNPTNMLRNGNFDIVSSEGLVGWRTVNYITGTDSEEVHGAFLMDLDNTFQVSTPYSLRLDGIWHNTTTGFFGAVALGSPAEGTYMLRVKPRRTYRVSGYYKTRGDFERASIYIGNPTESLIATSLPPTFDEWQAFEYVACHTSHRTESMQMLLRLHSTGTVWFDDVTVQPGGVELVGDCA